MQKKRLPGPDGCQVLQTGAEILLPVGLKGHGKGTDFEGSKITEELFDVDVPETQAPMVIPLAVVVMQMQLLKVPGHGLHPLP